MSKKKKNNIRRWHKYEPAGCFACRQGQLYRGGRTELDVTYYDRCECANIKTKRYTKFLEKAKKGKMSHKKYLKKSLMFFDNNRHIVVGNNAVERSW